MRIKKLPGGVEVIIRDVIYQQKAWKQGHWYEEAMLLYIRDTYPGGTYIDAGACIGNHTLCFAKFCAQQVIAVEPIPHNMQHLKDNVALNGLGNVVTVEAALGSQSGQGKMHRFGKHHGNWRLEDGDGVEVTTLDAVAELADYPITVVKMDIEGGELEALKGGTRVLTEHKPVLFLELKTGPEQERTGQFLKDFGYEPQKCFNASPTWEFTCTS